MNNVALMPDGALITARTLDAVTLAETAAGERDSLAGNDLVQTLLERPDHAAGFGDAPSGHLLAGTIDPTAVLDGDDEDGSGQSALDRTADRIATQIAEQAGMPPILLALAGTTGEMPISRACFTLLMASEEDAEAAAPVIEERLETGQSIVTQPLVGTFQRLDGQSGQGRAGRDGRTGDGAPGGVVQPGLQSGSRLHRLVISRAAISGLDCRYNVRLRFIAVGAWNRARGIQ